ncbi:MAG: BamA/TamA family outer membrane protein [bacterium]|nr:BamA/TamA family outer membrane protein [bacterium]
MMKNIFILIMLFLLVIAMSGIALSQETVTVSEPPEKAASSETSGDVYPKIGLALSGGGARGFAHIGALKVLRDIGMPIDYVAGTSMGSIVGGLYAAGYSVEELEEVITIVDWDGVFSDTPPRKMWSFLKKRQSSKYLFGLGFTGKGFSIPTGITKGQKISTLFSFLTIPASGIENFDDFPIPFRAIAADIVTGEEVVLSSGSLSEAMRASMSVPGVFTPVEMGEHLLVDGGIIKNLPVDVLKEMGADIVIAIDVSSGLVGREHLGNPVAILNQMVGLQMLKSTEAQRRLADVVIVTNLEDYSSADFGKGREISELGKQSTIEKADELNVLLDKIRETRPMGRNVPNSILQQFKNLYVEDVVIRGGENAYKETSVQKYFELQEKTPLDPELIQQAVTTLFSSGNYESVKFSLTKGAEKDGRILNLNVEEKTENPHLLRFGMYYESRNGDSEPDKMVFLLNATFNDLSGYGSFWSTDYEFVNVNKLQTQYFHPLGKVLFVLPRLYTFDDYQVIYEDQESVARYDLEEDGLTLALGSLVSRLGILTLGYNLEKVKVKPSSDVDPERFLSHDEMLSSLLVRSSVDRLDKFPFPHSGGLMEFNYQWASEQLGSDADFHKFSAEYWRYFPLATKHTLGTHLIIGTDFKSGLRPYKDFLLGGRDSFVGYKNEEVRGANIGIAALEYRYNFGTLPAPIGGNMYAILTGNVGNAWRTLDELQEDIDLRYGGSLGVGIDTFLGPLRADYSLGDEGRRILYINIGFKF